MNCCRASFGVRPISAAISSWVAPKRPRRQMFGLRPSQSRLRGRQIQWAGHLALSLNPCARKCSQSGTNQLWVAQKGLTPDIVRYCHPIMLPMNSPFASSKACALIISRESSDQLTASGASALLPKIASEIFSASIIVGALSRARNQRWH